LQGLSKSNQQNLASYLFIKTFMYNYILCSVSDVKLLNTHTHTHAQAHIAEKATSFESKMTK